MISWAVCALTTLALLADAGLAGYGGEGRRVRLVAVVLADPDSDIVPAGRFVHARHRRRDI
jgi:hypothetical protein